MYGHRDLKIAVLTSNKHCWMLHGFLHQWAKYTDDLAIEVVGYEGMSDLIFEGYHDVSRAVIGDQKDYPIEKWSNGLRRYLETQTKRYVLLFLEDYWLVRDIDSLDIMNMVRYLNSHTNVIRIDVTCDKLYYDHNVDIGFCGSMDLFRASFDEPYLFALQACIWDREKLLEVLRPGWTPWQAELAGTTLIKEKGYEVIGSKQASVKYQIMHTSADGFSWGRDGEYPYRYLTESDKEELIRYRCDLS